MDAKGKRLVDKFPLLLGITALVLSGTALNLVNWQHRQIDKLEDKVETQGVALVSAIETIKHLNSLMAEIRSRTEHINFIKANTSKSN